MTFVGTCLDALLVEKRELKAKETGVVWRTVAKLGFMGGMVEAIVPEGMTLPPEGTGCSFTGRFTNDSYGKQQFKLDKVEPKK